MKATLLVGVWAAHFCIQPLAAAQGFPKGWDDFEVVEFKGTCSKLLQEVQSKGLIGDKGDKTTVPGVWGLTTPIVRINGLTPEEFQKKGLLRLDYGPLNNLGMMDSPAGQTAGPRLICTAVAKHNMVFEPDISVKIVEWRHQWGHASTCGQEWARVRNFITAHELRHVRDAVESIKDLNRALADNLHFAVGCGNNQAEAEDKAAKGFGLVVERLMRGAVEAYQARIKAVDYEQGLINCEKCKRHVFRDLKVTTTMVPQKLPQAASPFTLLASGAFCGEPTETSSASARFESLAQGFAPSVWSTSASVELQGPGIVADVSYVRLEAIEPLLGARRVQLSIDTTKMLAGFDYSPSGTIASVVETEPSDEIGECDWGGPAPDWTDEEVFVPRSAPPPKPAIAVQPSS